MSSDDPAEAWESPLLEVRREGVTFKRYAFLVGVLSSLCFFASALLMYEAVKGWISIEEMGRLLVFPISIAMAMTAFLTYVRLLTPPATLVLYGDRLILRRDEGDRSAIKEIELDPSTRVELMFPWRSSGARGGPPYGLKVWNGDILTVDPSNGWDVEDFQRLLEAMVPLIEEGRVEAGVDLREYLATHRAP